MSRSNRRGYGKRRLRSPISGLLYHVSIEVVSGSLQAIPCNADDDDAGDSAKASRSRRTEEDCFKAALKREF